MILDNSEDLDVFVGERPNQAGSSVGKDEYQPISLAPQLSHGIVLVASRNRTTV